MTIQADIEICILERVLAFIILLSYFHLIRVFFPLTITSSILFLHFSPILSLVFLVLVIYSARAYIYSCESFLYSSLSRIFSHHNRYLLVCFRHRCYFLDKKFRLIFSVDHIPLHMHLHSDICNNILSVFCLPSDFIISSFLPLRPLIH